MGEFQIFGEICTVRNVCPKVTREEIAKRAGFHWRQMDGPGDVNDFAIELVYGGNQEIKTIQPQQTLTLQSAGAKIFMQTYKQLGLIVVDPKSDAVTQACRGLEAAIDHFNYVGEQQMASFRANMDQDQMARMKNEMRGTLINVEREKALRAELDRLMAGVDPVEEGTDELYDVDHLMESPCGKNRTLKDDRAMRMHTMRCSEPVCTTYYEDHYGKDQEAVVGASG